MRGWPKGCRGVHLEHRSLTSKKCSRGVRPTVQQTSRRSSTPDFMQDFLHVLLHNAASLVPNTLCQPIITRQQFIISVLVQSNGTGGGK